MDAMYLQFGLLSSNSGDQDDNYRIIIGDPESSNIKLINLYIFDDSNEIVEYTDSSIKNTIYKSEKFGSELWDCDSKLWKVISEKINSMSADDNINISAQRLHALYAYIQEEDTDEEILGEIEVVCNDNEEDAGEFFMNERYSNKFFLRITNGDFDDEGFCETLYGGVCVVAL